MDLVFAGHPSKNIVADLRVSQRTVESHRAQIMEKTGADSISALIRLGIAAASSHTLAPGASGSATANPSWSEVFSANMSCEISIAPLFVVLLHFIE